MNRLFYIASFFLFIPFITGISAKDNTDYKSLKISYLNIMGKTNVNSFEFYLANPKNDIVNIPINLNGQANKTLILRIPVKKLKTENEMMYSDFLRLLREEEYPEISIGIDDTPLLDSFEENLSIEPLISINIAGVTKEYKVKCMVDKLPEGKYIKGAVRIKLTDFNLEPPSKMLGLVKVKDEILINFAILFAV